MFNTSACFDILVCHIDDSGTGFSTWYVNIKYYILKVGI